MNATMNEDSAPTGLDLRLEGIPTWVSNKNLKTALKTILKIDYNFLVVSEDDHEHILHHENRSTTTARVIIPNGNNGGNNAGRCLINQKIRIDISDKPRFECQVTEIQPPTTTNEKYNELREQPFVQGIRLDDNLIGKVRQVSCGMFDQNNNYETTNTWKFQSSDIAPQVSYHGHVWPRRFRVPLTLRPSSHKPQEEEWMELLAPNIRGIIFEAPRDDQPSCSVIYFVVDKPPHFYQRVQVNSGQADLTAGTPKFVHSRMIHPSIVGQDGPRVFNVPWGIQYSRVFKIEYEPLSSPLAPLFNLAWYVRRMTRREKETVYCFEHPMIAESTRTIESMTSILQKNMTSIERLFPVECLPECRLAVLQLLYNGNVSAIAEETNSLICDVFSGKIGFQSSEATEGERRQFCEAYKASAQKMGTVHLRALRRLWSSSIAASRIPRTLKGKPIEPDQAIREQIEALRGGNDIHWSKLPPKSFEILMYPSHAELRGPESLGLSSITEQYLKNINSFLRVRFVDNDGRPFKPEPGINADIIINNRIVEPLRDGIKFFPGLTTKFEFLGYTISGLKKSKTVLFFSNDDEDLNAQKIRDGIGNWTVQDHKNKSLSRDPSKWGARISMAFTESLPVRPLFRGEWHHRADQGPNPGEFPNTDGCGLITQELCDEINTKLAAVGYKVSDLLVFLTSSTHIYSG